MTLHTLERNLAGHCELPSGGGELNQIYTRAANALKFRAVPSIPVILY